MTRMEVIQIETNPVIKHLVKKDLLKKFINICFLTKIKTQIIYFSGKLTEGDIN